MRSKTSFYGSGIKDCVNLEEDWMGCKEIRLLYIFSLK